MRRHIGPGRLVLLLKVFLAVFSPAALAQLPLSIEQLLVPEHRLQWFSAADYASEGTLPGRETRVAQLNTGLRWGVGRRWEVSASLGRAAVSRYQGTTALRDEQISLSLGSNWQLRREDHLPAVLLGLRLGQDDLSAAQSVRRAGVTATLYQSFDPVVLSLHLAAGAQRSHAVGAARQQRYWQVSPEVNFAVNPQVTLVGGLRYLRRETGQGGAQPETLALRGGIGLAFTASDTLFLLGTLSGSGAENRIAVQWFHQF